MEALNRRKFIRKTTLIAVAVSLPCFESRKEDKQNPLKQAPPKTNCSTTADILWPFYKSDVTFTIYLIS
jgi:hypothetical protein